MMWHKTSGRKAFNGFRFRDTKRRDVTQLSVWCGFYSRARKNLCSTNTKRKKGLRRASFCSRRWAHWDILWFHLHAKRLIPRNPSVPSLAQNTYKLMNVISCFTSVFLRRPTSSGRCWRAFDVLYVKRHGVLVVKKVKTLFIVDD